jgi:Asp/Glu/hydantoin racemase
MAGTLALIHTSPVLVPVFSTLCTRHLPGTAVFHMVDESLIKNTIATGALQKATIRNVVAHVDSAARAGAGAVLVTCSSIGEAVPVARQLFDLPLFRIDEPMAERAVESGTRIGVLATLETTLAPTVRLLNETARARGLHREIVSCLCRGAFDAVLAGETATHDRLVESNLTELLGSVDVVVLAQASMARVVANLRPELRTVPILSSPELAVERVAEVLTSAPTSGTTSLAAGPGTFASGTCR